MVASTSDLYLFKGCEESALPGQERGCATLTGRPTSGRWRAVLGDKALEFAGRHHPANGVAVRAQLIDRHRFNVPSLAVYTVSIGHADRCQAGSRDNNNDTIRVLQAHLSYKRLERICHPDRYLQATSSTTSTSNESRPVTPVT